MNRELVNSDFAPRDKIRFLSKKTLKPQFSGKILKIHEKKSKPERTQGSTEISKPGTGRTQF